jgi:hypothetical protein
MSETPLTGGCNCGAVKFEITEPLPYAYYCHCTRCQKRSGAGASPGAVAMPGSFKLISGEDELRTWNAGDGWDKWFCSVCGSHTHASNPENPELVSVRLGSLDGDPGVRPTGRHYVNYAARWEPVDPDDGLTHHPEALGSG